MLVTVCLARRAHRMSVTEATVPRALTRVARVVADTRRIARTANVENKPRGARLAQDAGDSARVTARVGARAQRGVARLAAAAHRHRRLWPVRPIPRKDLRDEQRCHRRVALGLLGARR